MKKLYYFICLIMYIFFIYNITYKNEEIYVKDVYILENTVLVNKINNKLITKKIYENNVYEITKNGNYKIFFKNNKYIAYKSSYFNKFRNYIDNRINTVFNYKLRGYAKALLLRDKSYLDNIKLLIIRKNGLLHIFSTSGLHLSLIYIVIESFLFKFNKKIKYIISILLISVYVFILGFSPSITRAYFTIIAYYISDIFSLKIKREKLLLYIFIITFLSNPYQLIELSYILTYLITLTILLINNNSIFLKSLIIELVLLPIMYLGVGEFNLISFLVNIIYIPLFTVLIYFIIIALFINLPILTSFINDYVEIIDNSLYFIYKIEIFSINFNKTYFIFLLLLYLIVVFAYFMYILLFD